MMAELERHTAEDERQQHQCDRHVEGGHESGVGFREGRKESAAPQDQPCLVAVPHGGDGGLHVVAFARVLGEGEEDADAEIEADRARAPTQSSPVEVSVGRINALLKFDRRAGLPIIKAETLVMGTGTDFITPSYFSKALAQTIPGAKLTLYEDGGHSFTTTRAEPFNRDLMAFLLSK